MYPPLALYGVESESLVKTWLRFRPELFEVLNKGSWDFRLA